MKKGGEAIIAAIKGKKKKGTVNSSQGGKIGILARIGLARDDAGLKKGRDAPFNVSRESAVQQKM